MALEIKRAAESPPPGGIVADRRLWLTSDGRVVEDGDSAATILLAGCAGNFIPAESVARYGLELKDGEVHQRPAAKSAAKATAPTADPKGVPKPAQE